MCLICIELDKSGMTFREARRALGEMRLKLDPAHIDEVEAKLHDTYYTEPLTIRPYQDSSKLYLNAKVFYKLFPGRVPEFSGKPAH